MKGRLGRRSAALGALVVWAALPGGGSAQSAGFPHRLHDGLFPLCSGCHATSSSEVSGITLPEAEVCARCHDGVTRARVEWSGARARRTSLRFSHAEHPMRRRADDPSSACATCHGDPRVSGRMAVVAARPETCFTCHESESPDHFGPEAACRTCHLPLTEAKSLTATWVAELPRPASHEDPVWLLGHAVAAEGSLQTCSICHARESCERCHLNAGSVGPIQDLEPDPRVAALVEGRAPDYPRPPSHRGGGWSWRHRDVARAQGTSFCGNCHTRSSCRTCHLEGGSTALGDLPTPAPGDPRGVRLPRAAERVHEPGFARSHGVQASAAEAACVSCHEPSSFCASCHAGGSDPGFHLDDFLSQHAAEAYGNEADCASCHSPELFCRSCHRAVGLASAGRLDAGFHNAQPFWLLEHGEGARKGLESCTTCHAQSDCARCHSARGGWRVNPHGPDFDARRMREQAPLTCLRCHFGDPLRGGG